MNGPTSAPADGQAVAEQGAYTVADIVAKLNVDETTVYREIRAGRLRAMRVGSGRGTYRVTREAYADYVAAAEVIA